VFPDRRDPTRVVHSLVDMFRARVFAICCGYENDDDLTAETLLRLTRTGRAASYHEFELSLGSLSGLQVSSLNRWKRGNPLQFAKWFAFDRSSRDGSDAMARE
jgi:hypothetical protein